MSSYFTNTYTVGFGRENYLRIDHLEDPLFTSFTFDIDFTTSPLFYTISGNSYGYPNVEGMGNRIETSLEYMYGKNISIDDGYDILPMLSANILDGNKLGFGIQQNVYLDKPLYGATEYIYMVDKRNGGSDQNDVRINDNRVPSLNNNSYKLGDSVKNIVNDSDRAWAERKNQQSNEQIAACNEIMNDDGVKKEHEKFKAEMDAAMLECNQNSKVKVGDKEYTESELQQEIKKYKNKENEFEKFKQEIVDWANGEISQCQNKVTDVYMKNKCVQKIITYDDISICGDEKKETYRNELKKIYGDNYVNDYISGGENSFLNKTINVYNDLKLFLDIKGSEERVEILQKNVIEKFGDKLEYFGLYKKGDSSFTGKIQVITMKSHPDWLNKISTAFPVFVSKDDEIKQVKNLMAFQCDGGVSFSEFESDVIKTNDNELGKYEEALDNLRTGLYGYKNGKPCEISNPDPNSPYGKYLAAKEKYENDEYSQAEKTKTIAQSGAIDTMVMMSLDDYQEEFYEHAYENGYEDVVINKNKSIVVSQTVLDILGFINGMWSMVLYYPYIIQGVTGLDTAYNKHYGIKDPYLGSGDDKITLTCLESLDLRVSSMFNRYFNAVYDRQYRRERVPVNLRRFNCSIYVHDVRHFASIMRTGQLYENRVLELANMHYSVIEFRFYDCEIVPEETGNIFDSVSNESPSEMKKTNFTFTYGNCVVNFVPPSEVNKKQKSQGLKP